MSADKTSAGLSLEEIKKLPHEEAIAALTCVLERNPGNDEALAMRGQLHWTMNHRREAINDYLAAITINPESRAKMLLEYAYSILDFYSKDLLNP